MVNLAQGEIWWADLGEPVGSTPGYRRPVVIVQGDSLNLSRISTVVCVPLTSNLKWSTAPGNVRLNASATGLPQDSVANVSQILTIDQDSLVELTGKIDRKKLGLILAGIDIVLGR